MGATTAIGEMKTTYNISESEEPYTNLTRGNAKDLSSQQSTQISEIFVTMKRENLDKTKREGLFKEILQVGGFGGRNGLEIDVQEPSTYPIFKEFFYNKDVEETFELWKGYRFRLVINLDKEQKEGHITLDGHHEGYEQYYEISRFVGQHFKPIFSFKQAEDLIKRLQMATFDVLRKQNSILQTRLRSSEIAHTELQALHNGLQIQHNNLRTKVEALVEKHNHLTTSHNRLLAALKTKEADCIIM